MVGQGRVLIGLATKTNASIRLLFPFPYISTTTMSDRPYIRRARAFEDDNDPVLPSRESQSSRDRPGRGSRPQWSNREDEPYEPRSRYHDR